MGTAYGIVHRARDTETQDVVALKSVRIFDQDKGEGSQYTFSKVPR